MNAFVIRVEAIIYLILHNLHDCTFKVFCALVNQGGLNKKEIKWNICNLFSILIFKGALSGLRHSLATKSPLKIMKNAFFHLKTSFCSQDI